MREAAIRRMTLEDVDAVHALEAQAFAQPWTRDMFVQEMTSNPVARYLVAEQAGRVIAFAGIHIVLDEGHITNIAVGAAHQGHGLGRRLTQALLQYAANLGVRYATLEVRVSNASAQAMYKALGFHAVHVRKRYYEDNGEDALLMVCDRLPPAEPDFTEPETLLEG